MKAMGNEGMAMGTADMGKARYTLRRHSLKQYEDQWKRSCRINTQGS